MKTNLGFLHREEEFILNNVRYKALYADGEQHVICRNLETNKNEKIAIDCEVEEVE